ncbi:MAG: hypothetical protein LBJ57_05905 [Prevotellaceae bacterium]|nr:hypothetical protein [Prevotellaceae bacterium]
MPVWAALIFFLLPSCREENHPEVSFLPCAQISFVDSIVEINLQMVDLEIYTTLRATVLSPVGLSKIEIAQVNKLGSRLVDTVVVKEVTSFDDENRWTINEEIQLAGYTEGINVRTYDKQGQMSQRMLPVKLENTKLRPAIIWLNANGTENTSYAANGVAVKKYGANPLIPELWARIESRNGNEWSWGLDKLNTYLVYADGTLAPVAEATRNLSEAPCSGCRNTFEFRFTPDYTGEVKQILLAATDLKMQKTESYINVKVYDDYPAPQIMYAQSKLTIDRNDLSQAVVEFDVASEDVRFSRVVYYLVRSNGDADSVGVRAAGFPDLPSGATYKIHLTYRLTDIENVVAFRVKAVNRNNLSSQEDLPIEIAPGAEGVKHVRNIVTYTYDDRVARNYVYSVASNRLYKDGTEGSESEGVTDPDIVFRSGNDAYIYPDAPINNTSTTWKGDKQRKTFFVKLMPTHGVDFETATREQILMFDSIVDRMGELTVSAANRPKQSLIAVVKAIVVDGKGRLLSVVEDNSAVDQPPGAWELVRISYNLDTRIATYAATAKRDEAAMSITYAFKTHDGIVGLLKLTEGLAYQPGINANAVRIQRQRITFSVKTVEQQPTTDI